MVNARERKQKKEEPESPNIGNGVNGRRWPRLICLLVREYSGVSAVFRVSPIDDRYDFGGRPPALYVIRSHRVFPYNASFGRILYCFLRSREAAADCFLDDDKSDINGGAWIFIFHDQTDRFYPILSIQIWLAPNVGCTSYN